MKKYLSYTWILVLLSLSCKTVDYDWEDFKYAPTPKVNLNAAASALPTFSSAKVSFFNMADPDFATSQKFEWELDFHDASGRAAVSEIEVYVSFNKRENNVPVYPVILSLAKVHPNERQFPLPSTIRATDKLFEKVNSFPKSYSFTPAELASLTGTNLATIGVNDYFLFKFVVVMSDGTRITQYNDNSCDESRGELCDCRVGVRFKNLK
ncbi:hypothetical protein P872_11610 [Rhodonellum psychrophilum GCM71 = DSM 17998]|uniref:Lipoprotein n=2 Tax=Rhodonellum TaxID=336827 RepID=U5BWB8_9BACT|nr:MULTISPECIES: hypothetical protein [Rhodonellum]ERM80891.1 hypothetical protein P872_11610 [Rhodonellum psychrophilum GCM71 = DSM 17998]MDO9552891.1 hypothetical protein [Rhodonellum sp.]SDZ33099.1 hypothetical protein SAMN05444412_110121 [Rhodonellum ikkaensis]